jgi:amino acid permease
MKARTLLFSIGGGILITLVTGLVSNTPTMMVGAEYYGYPLPWLIRMVVAPQYFPWVVDYVRLIGDIIVWTIVATIVLIELAMARRSHRQKT